MDEKWRRSTHVYIMHIYVYMWCEYIDIMCVCVFKNILSHHLCHSSNPQNPFTPQMRS